MEAEGARGKVDTLQVEMDSLPEEHLVVTPTRQVWLSTCLEFDLCQLSLKRWLSIIYPYSKYLQLRAATFEENTRFPLVLEILEKWEGIF